LQALLDNAADAAQLDHLAIKGHLREVTPLLPNGIEAATGIVVDSDGRQSHQIDIIIYSLLPSFMQVGEHITPDYYQRVK